MAALQSVLRIWPALTDVGVMGSLIYLSLRGITGLDPEIRQ